VTQWVSLIQNIEAHICVRVRARRHAYTLASIMHEALCAVFFYEILLVAM